MKFQVGAAPFINGASCSIYKWSKIDLDSWSSSLYKWVLQLAIASWSSSLYKGNNFTVGAQHINFQTKSGHLTDQFGEAIDHFKHILDKTALVWFQTNRSKLKDLTTLKTMFLQRYNPWGKRTVTIMEHIIV